MNEAAFYRSAVPEPFRILGLRLRPFSLGHLLILKRIESPFVLPDAEINVGDLALAILICSSTFEEAVELLGDPKLPARLFKWGRKHQKTDIQAKADLFRRYLAQGLDTPDYMCEADRCRPIDAPSEQVVKIILLSKTNLTETEILNRPWSLCVWDMLSLRAIEGQLQFVDHEVLEDLQRQANEFAERMNAQSIQTPSGN